MPAIGVSSENARKAIDLIADSQQSDHQRIDLRKLDRAVKTAQQSGDIRECLAILRRVANCQTLIVSTALFGPELDKQHLAQALLKELKERFALSSSRA